MKIYNAEQLARADKITIEKQGITSESLMERAATLIFQEIHHRLNHQPVEIKIFCGVGNNGGDGLVIGRLLLQEGYKVTIYVVNYTSERSPNFLSNYHKIKDLKGAGPILLKSEDDFPEINSQDFVIDAIFGIGLNRPAEGWVAQLINFLNNSGAFILAVDMPSGLFADKTPKPEDAVIKANFTISFQSPKMTFFLQQTQEYVGDMQVIDIGLDEEFLNNAPAVAQLTNKSTVLQFYIPRKNFSHKGDYGHSLIIGGSFGKIGSIALTATATLRTGAGLVSIFSPRCGYEIIQTLLPEAMVFIDQEEKEIKNIEFDIEPDVICFGMGAGTSKNTAAAFESLLKNTHKPMVIDADGLNLLASNSSLLKFLPENSVLTPHPKELERLLGKWEDDFDKLKKAKEFSSLHKLILVLKDAYTFVVFGDELFINTTGNPGMATAGSGDVLAGVITSLISQKYKPLQAAIMGTYLHGRAGDIAAEKLSYQGLIAGDIAAYMGAAFLDLFKNDEEGMSY